MPATKVEGYWFRQGDQSVKVSEHFTAGEFYRHKRGNWFVNAELPPLLERIRTGCGDRPCYLNSVFRTQEQNRAVGGADNSEHMEGAAADIDTASYAETIALAVVAVKAGCLRIGISRSFLHVGVRDTGGKLVVWGYAPYSTDRVKYDLTRALERARVVVK